MTGGMAFWRTLGQTLADGRDVIELDILADSLAMGAQDGLAGELRARAPGLIVDDWLAFLGAVDRAADAYAALRRHHGQAALDQLLGLVAGALTRPPRDAAPRQYCNPTAIRAGNAPTRGDWEG